MSKELYKSLQENRFSRREFLRKTGLATGTLAISSSLAGLPVFAQGETVKIGVLFIMSGPLAVFGESCLKAVQLAKTQLNEAGEPLGKRVELEIADSTTDPTTLRDATKKLVNVKQVPAMVGPMIRSDVAVPVTAPNHVVGISPTNTPEWVGRLDDNDYHYRTTVSDDIQGAVLGKLAWDQGYKSASSIYVNDPYGPPLSAIAMEKFEELGGNGMAQVAYNPGKPSYKMQLLMAARGNPDVLMLIGYVDDGITILREAISGGYFSEFLFTDGMKSQKIADATGEALEGMHGTSPGTTETPSHEIYHSAFETTYGAPPATGFTEQSYDAAVVIGLAIHSAGIDAFSEDPGKAVRDHLREVANPPGEEIYAGTDEFKKAFELLDAGKQINYEGAAGSIDFDEKGDVLSGILIWRIENGKLVTVRTELPKR